MSEFIHQSTCGVCVDNVAAGSARGIECVDEAATKVSEHVTNGESVDSTEGNGMYDLHELESCNMHEVECSATHYVNSSDMCSEVNPKFWEVESSGLKQITDVQGRLKKHLMYWKMYCMAIAFRLSLFPQRAFSATTTQQQPTMSL